MANTPNTRTLVQTIFSFKSAAYSTAVQELVERLNNEGASSEQTINAIRESISSFIIETYTALDAVSKDIPVESDRNAYWSAAESTVSELSNQWLEELASVVPSIKSNLELIRGNVREFNTRAVNFHRERQRLSHSLNPLAANVG